MPFDNISVDEVLLKLKPKKVTKVLLLGNSGVGKTMLLNTLLARLAFESKMSLRRVTTKMDVAVYQAGDEVYLLYNIPGLADPDEQIALENAAIIEQAIRDRADLPTIAFFVLTVEGGRLRPEDINAWRSISTFVPGLKDKTAVSFIVNKAPFDGFESKEQQVVFETELRLALHALCGAPIEILMLPNIITKDRDDLGSAAMLSVRSSLVSAMRKLRGKVLRVPDGAQLQLKLASLQEEFAGMKRLVEELRREIHEQAKSHEAALKAMIEKQKPSRDVDWEAVMRGFFDVLKLALIAYMQMKGGGEEKK